MSNHCFSSTRRRLLDSAPAAAVTLLMATGFAPTARAVETHAQATGPVTFYADVRVAQPNKAALDAGLQAFANSMVARGALAVTLKQMVGDSTMVRNYPEGYKGLLKSAYADAAQAGTLPLFYSRFVRFADMQAPRAAQTDAAFDHDILPRLHGVLMKDGKPVPSPKPRVASRGVFETTLAGNRHGIYTSHDASCNFSVVRWTMASRLS